jgi:hypothetical protein
MDQINAMAKQFSSARLIGRQLNDLPMALACMAHAGVQLKNVAVSNWPNELLS